MVGSLPYYCQVLSCHTASPSLCSEWALLDEFSLKIESVLEKTYAGSACEFLRLIVHVAHLSGRKLAEFYFELMIQFSEVQSKTLQVYHHSSVLHVLLIEETYKQSQMFSVSVL